MNPLVINFITLTCGIFCGMWLRNQLNEDKNPLDSILAASKAVAKFCTDSWKYCMKKVPKKAKS